VTTFSYANDPAEGARTDLLILPVLQGEDGPVAGPGVASGLLGAYAGARLTGKRGENLLVPGPSDAFVAGAVLLVGLGPRDELSVDVVRRALGRVAGTARRFATVASTVAQVLPLRRAAEGVTAVAEGLALGAYRFDRYRSSPDEGGLEAVTVLGADRWDAKAMGAALHRADVVVDAVSWARDLVNTPAGDLPPAAIADAAASMAGEVGLTWPGALRLRCTTDCGYVIVYDERPDALCVEPQTAPPDGINTVPTLVRPGAPRTAHAVWSWSRG